MRRGRNEVTFGLDEITCVVCDTKMVWSDEEFGWKCPKCNNFAYQCEDCAADELYFEKDRDDENE